MDRVKFDVGGQIFAINRNLLASGSCLKLSQLSKFDRDVIVIDRPPEMFAAVLALCQTGELHVPKSCCPGAFMLELDYWGIKTDQLATCCYFKVHRFLNEQQNIKKFENSMHKELETPTKSESGAAASFKMVRNRVWSVVDFREKTAMATIYFGVSLLMVLISICNLAFSTDPNFRRNMTNCERYEYMKGVGMDDLDLVADMLQADCGNTSSSMNATHAVSPPPFKKIGDEDDDFVALEIKLWPTTPKPDIICNPVVNATEILGNGTNPKNETGDVRCRFKFGMRFMPAPQLKRIKIPNFKIPIDMFKILELITTIYFTADISIRQFSCPSFLLYFTSPVNIADAVALIGVYMNWVLTSVRPEELYETNWFDLLEYLQMLRSLRLFRLVMSFNISKVLAYSVGQSLKDGFIMVLLLITGMCTFSICLYLSEDKYTVKTIPDAWYWSVITMTTVGYGDLSPKSPFGKFVACVCSVSGVLVFALTVPLFVNQFMTLYQYADVTIAHTIDANVVVEDRIDVNKYKTKKPVRGNAIKIRAESVRVTTT